MRRVQISSRELRLTGMDGFAPQALPKAHKHGPTYAWCVAWRASLPAVRQRAVPNRQSACNYRRVARLPKVIGDALDGAGVAFRWLRYVAWANGPHERNRRFNEVMARQQERIAANAAPTLEASPATLAAALTQISQFVATMQGNGAGPPLGSSADDGPGTPSE